MMVDYNEISRPRLSSGGGLSHFPAALKSVPGIASQLADYILFLTEIGFLHGPEQVHLIGESLGAQIAGFIGKEIFKRTGKLIGRISGLDPAGT